MDAAPEKELSVPGGCVRVGEQTIQLLQLPTPDPPEVDAPEADAPEPSPRGGRRASSSTTRLLEDDGAARGRAAYVESVGLD